jgi:hypothetical protein
MAFLAPEITKAIIDGSQPGTLKMKKFKGDIPLGWSKQQGYVQRA